MSEEEKDAYEKSRKACVRSRAAALLRDRPRRWSLILSLSGCLHVSETLLTRADSAAVGRSCDRAERHSCLGHFAKLMHNNE